MVTRIGRDLWLAGIFLATILTQGGALLETCGERRAARRGEASAAGGMFVDSGGVVNYLLVQNEAEGGTPCELYCRYRFS
jgi:hypothetical protein